MYVDIDAVSVAITLVAVVGIFAIWGVIEWRILLREKRAETGLSTVERVRYRRMRKRIEKSAQTFSWEEVEV